MTDSARIVIVGGGPVGAALALALADGGLSPLVLEAREPHVGGSDPRPVALSYGSRLLLDRLGVWERMAPATPIDRIHVSQKGAFGRVTLAAGEAGQPALGYVVEYARLRHGLAQAMAEHAAISVSSADVTAVRPGDNAAIVEFNEQGAGKVLSADLVVVADGGALQGLSNVKTVDYRQVAVVAGVASELPHGNVAFERFTTDGPLALLPHGDRLALIWTANPQRAQQLCALAEDEFLHELGAQFGARLGGFAALGARAAYPLALKFSPQIVRPRVVLIGNAAQTLHPVAGQGFNLGLRDAWELAAVAANTGPEALGDAAMLSRYSARRRIDRGGGIGFTDALVRLFSNDIAPLRVARGLGLALLGCLPPAKTFMIRRMTFGARG